MSKTRNTSQTAILNEPHLEPIYGDHTSEKTLKPLNDLLYHFNQLLTQYDLFVGLNEEEASSLKEKLKNRPRFSDLHQVVSEKNFDAYKKYIANERSIVPFARAMAWWEVNLRALRKNITWERIQEKLIKNAEINFESREETEWKSFALKTIQHKWRMHEIFAGYSTNALIEFYTTHLHLMKKTLRIFLKKSRIPHTIRDAIQTTQQSLKKIETAAVLSMIDRLRAGYECDDMQNDDVLSLLVKDIFNICHVKILDLNKRPKRRMGLNEENIGKMRELILRFIKKNKEAEIIEIEFSRLPMNSVSRLWRERNHVKLKDKIMMSHASFRLTELKHTIDKMVDLSKKPVNIEKYLKKCEQLIFNRMDFICDKKTLVFDKAPLISLSALLAKLANNELKIQLLHHVKNEVHDNPYWLTLINHLDDKERLAYLEKTFSDNPALKPSPLFISVLLFSKKLVHYAELLDDKINSLAKDQASIGKRHAIKTFFKKLTFSFWRKRNDHGSLASQITSHEPRP